MKIAIGCDHVGYELKGAVIRHLTAQLHVLIPGKGDILVEIIGYQGKVGIDPAFFARQASPSFLSSVTKCFTACWGCCSSSLKKCG